jgi:hypothetical protein
VSEAVSQAVVTPEKDCQTLRARKIELAGSTYYCLAYGIGPRSQEFDATVDALDKAEGGDAIALAARLFHIALGLWYEADTIQSLLDSEVLGPDDVKRLVRAVYGQESV